MRALIPRILALTFAVLSAASCDSPSLTGSGTAASASIAIPRLSAERAIAAELDPEPSAINVRITDVASGEVIHSRDYTLADITNFDPDGAVTGSLEVRFNLPEPGAVGPFELVAEVRNAAGVILFRIGPLQFTLGANGRTAQVEADAVYVGPGADVTGVRVTPTSLTLAVGQTAPVMCLGTPGDVTDFPFFWDTNNQAIASVSGNIVTGVAPGTTQVFCELAIRRNGPSANVQVTVTAAPGSLQIISGANQTAPAGSSLPLPVRFEVRATNGQPIADALVRATVTVGGGNTTPTEVRTASDGSGQLQWVLGTIVGTQTIQLMVVGTTLTQDVNATATTQPAGATVAGTTRNAQTGLVLSGVLVELRAGTNVTTGTPLQSATTTSSGGFTFINIPAGNYTLRGTASGFAQAVQNIVVPSSGTVSVVLSLSPLLTAGQVRIVLSWGSTPPDLDAHLSVPGVGIVYFGNLGTVGSPFFATLDADEVSGFGPETITIHQLLSGTYTFLVHDFTNFSGSFTALAQSGARVDVYVGTSAVASFTFTPPQQSGVLWTVFTLVSAGGGNVNVTPVGTISPVGPFGSPATSRTGQAALLKAFAYRTR